MSAWRGAFGRVAAPPPSRRLSVKAASWLRCCTGSRFRSFALLRMSAESPMRLRACVVSGEDGFGASCLSADVDSSVRTSARNRESRRPPAGPGRAVVLRIEPSSLRCGRLAPSASIADALAQRASQGRVEAGIGGRAGLVGPPTVSRRSHRQGLRVLRTLAACGRLRNPDGCAAPCFSAVPGNPARHSFQGEDHDRTYY